MQYTTKNIDVDLIVNTLLIIATVNSDLNLCTQTLR